MQEKKSTILIIEDDVQISKMLQIILDAAGYKTVDSTLGKQGARLSASVKPDLVLLDLGLPDIDGKEVITAIRTWSQMPIIILSVRSDESEITTALNMGADDYVTKPFSTEILLARINANLRKAAVREAGMPEIINGPIRMDLVRHEVYLSGKLVAFTPKEYELLRYLLIHRGKMLTHKQILKEVWGGVYVENTQYLRVFIGQIREKLETVPALKSAIVTTPGIGYRMEILD
jgi:two-component system, OmpR family, KDP operon response regulator KdpE